MFVFTVFATINETQPYYTSSTANIHHTNKHDLDWVSCELLRLRTLRQLVVLYRHEKPEGIVSLENIKHMRVLVSLTGGPV